MFVLTAGMPEIFYKNNLCQDGQANWILIVHDNSIILAAFQSRFNG